MFTTWPSATVYLAGQPIKLKLKALHFSESGDFLRKVDLYNRKVLQGTADFGESFLPSDIKEWFRLWVKLQDPVMIDGETITTGEQLYDVATAGIVHAVIGKLCDYARLSSAEGKASSSPSTSEPARATSDGDSPAISIEPAAGIVP